MRISLTGNDLFGIGMGSFLPYRVRLFTCQTTCERSRHHSQHWVKFASQKLATYVGFKLPILYIETDFWQTYAFLISAALIFWQTCYAPVRHPVLISDDLIHWDRDKMADIFQTTFSNVFSWMKMYEFLLRFHWSLFLRVILTIFQHWSR